MKVRTIHEQDSENKCVFQVLRRDVELGELTITQFKAFPTEWAPKISFPLTDLTQPEFEELNGIVKEQVDQKRGKWVVVVVKGGEEGGPLIQKYLSAGFSHYFTSLHYSLDLTSFDMTVPEIPSVVVERWLDSEVGGHLGEDNRKKWETLYSVEYEADFAVRSSGRWDMTNPDPNEFIQRFEEGQADEESLFIARVGETIVGLSYAWTEGEEAGIFFTGVVPDYCSRGIATALKVALACHLKQRGFIRLLTNNRETNKAILATNEKLGFGLTSHEDYFRVAVRNE